MKNVTTEYEMFIRRLQKCSNGQYLPNCRTKKSRENCRVTLNFSSLKTIKSNLLFIIENVYKGKKPVIGTGEYDGGIYCDYVDENGIEMRDVITVCKIQKKVGNIKPKSWF